MGEPWATQLFDASIVMPCLNEAETLEACIREINSMAISHNLNIEIIVADNGSTDMSQEIARRNGARVVNVKEKGYGSALNSGILEASSEFIVIGDADMSYNFNHAPRFLRKLHEGADLVVGNRFQGGIASGAMPPLHKYFGNPVLSFIAKVLFQIRIGDFHCGLRAFKKSAYVKSNPVTKGMEFATEMVIRMANAGAKIDEVPTELRVDGRTRKPHLRSFPDGWRHLKLMLLYSPKYLQIYPGIIISLIGAVSVLEYVIKGKIFLFFTNGSLQTALMLLVVMLFGVQLYISGALNIEYGIQKNIKRLGGEPKIVKFLKSKFAVATSAIGYIIGICVMVPEVVKWRESRFGYLDPFTSSRHSLLMIFCTVLSTQIAIGALQIRQFTSRFW